MDTKPKTFADRMRAEARSIDGQRWPWGISFVMNGLERDLVEGMKAFAQLWFLNYTDETELPAEFYRMKDLLDDLHVDENSDLEDDEDEDEDEDAEALGRFEQ